MGGELMRWLFLACALLCGSAHAQMLQANTNAVTHSGGTPLTISCPGTGSASSTITCTGTYTGTAPATTGWTYSWNTTCTGSGSVTSVASVSLGSITGIVVPTPSGACAGTVTLTTNIPTSNGSGVVTISAPTPWTLVASTQLVGGTTGGTTSAINCTGANLIVIPVQYFGTGTFTSLTDSTGANAYTNRGNSGVATQAAITVADKISPTVTSSMTFTLAGVSVFATMTVMCFKDNSGTPTFDTTIQFNTTSGATSLVAGSSAITPSGNNALVIAGLATDSTGLPTISGGFSLGAQLAVNPGVYEGGSGWYFSQPTAASINPTMTFGSSGAAASLLMDYLP